MIHNLLNSCALYSMLLTQLPGFTDLDHAQVILTYQNINWESCCTKAGNSHPLTLCHMMIDCIQECGFSQVINFPTRRNNILDIFFTNRPSLIRKCHTLPGISDHEIIYLESSMKSKLLKCPNIRYWYGLEQISPQLNQLHKTLIPVFQRKIL